MSIEKCEMHGVYDYHRCKKTNAVSKSDSVTGSDALPLDETWDSFLTWVADYCGGGGTARRASYSREDMRYAFAAGYAKKRGEQ